MRLLSAPALIFHLELDGSELSNAELEARGFETDESALVLDDYGVASRLSYRFLRTMPTDALFARASRGELRTRDADSRGRPRAHGRPARSRLGLALL